MTIRVVLALVVSLGWFLRQVDINNAFLNSDLHATREQWLATAHASSPVEDEYLYRSIIGALQYVVITRPNIAFSMNKVFQFVHKLLDLHFKGVKRILDYLQGTLDHGLRSIAKAEYRSLAHVTTEMVWIQSLLFELYVLVKNKELVWCDSLAAIAVAGNPVMHSKFKHVELDLFFVKEKVARGSLQMGYVPSQDQIEDILAKPLSLGLFNKFRSQLKILTNDHEVTGGRERQGARGML
ncbi:hypothetical protein EPI10_022088 [Gossypium australe]|uniref:Uncharacterized protein n=1 Tax=Gossypium australe TaxID=47621 RepID=A0A5B6WL03_9ROSI|nr:hypothetical protein EPI10_022088 [Gossypium australe]